MSVNQNEKKGICEICHQKISYSQLFPMRLIRFPVLEIAKKYNSSLNDQGHICLKDLQKMRIDYIEDLLEEDKGALSKLDQEVLESLENQDILAENINRKFESHLTFGEKIADKITKFGGSWKFIISFFLIIIIWMVINSVFFIQKIFDPYPFILLNLTLSCLAAVQAPIIMMSQNRQSQKERLRANEDYCTNLKAELEIQQLHSKIDLFMKKQWESLIEIQKVQIELSQDLLRSKEKKKENKAH